MFWWIGAAWAIEVAEVPNPRASGSWVSDVAGVLDADTERRLDARLDALHRDTDVELAVVTVPDVPTSPKVFATALFNHWGIGDRDADNGVLVLLVLGDRRLEMETGIGMQDALPADWLARMQGEVMVPRFKAGDFGGGLEQGLARVDDHLRGAERASTLTRDYWVLVGSLVGVGFAGIGGITALGRGFHRRERTCARCGVFMPALSEEEEDAHLDAGQQAEEAIRSVEWTVHVCPTCRDVRTFSVTRWFSGHTSCPKCAYRTRSTRSTTLTAATTTSTGVQEVEESCAHCGYHARHTHTIAMLSYADVGGSGSSSDSGGSSDFGGGSSDGGGAGSSW